MESVNTKSWVAYPTNNHFPIENFPFGSFVHPTTGITQCCTRVGDWVIDLAWLESEGILAENGKHWAALNSEGKRVFNHKFNNGFIDLGKEVWHETRLAL